MRIQPLSMLFAGLLIGGCAVQVADKNAGTDTVKRPALPEISTEPVDSAPSEKLDPATLVDAVPRWEPITEAGNTTPYTVDGKIYYVMRDRSNFQQRGMASWYGTKFHGRETANGEFYDMYKMTAAHRNLPIPSYVRVTNLENAKSVIVRINDRGPFRSHRIIDLSYAAAVKLGFADEGIALVKLDVIDMPPPGSPAAPMAPVSPSMRATTPQPRQQLSAPAPGSVPAPAATGVIKAPAAPSVRTVGTYYVQVAAFASRDAAESLQQQLHTKTGREVMILTGTERPAVHRVRLGPVSDPVEARELMRDIERDTGILPILVNVKADSH